MYKKLMCLHFVSPPWCLFSGENPAAVFTEQLQALQASHNIQRLASSPELRDVGRVGERHYIDKSVE